eukprot:COSAG02_NODE_5168_length_4575_cov_2.869303_1_plen_114_part_10
MKPRAPVPTSQGLVRMRREASERDTQEHMRDLSTLRCTIRFELMFGTGAGMYRVVLRVLSSAKHTDDARLVAASLSRPPARGSPPSEDAAAAPAVGVVAHDLPAEQKDSMYSSP